MIKLLRRLPHNIPARSLLFRARFWVKTYLYFLAPGGWGYYRKLRRFRDPSYIHQRDRHVVRVKHNGESGWRVEAEDGVLRRDYASYEEYLIHQRQKFDEMLKLTGGFDNRLIFDFRQRFYRRFRHLTGLIPRSATIVCAGARQGTEVEVLRDLGFSKAYGIDLNPGPDNPLVRQGDFMNMNERSDSVDLLYTNCVDHAFDLDRFFAEHARVIKPTGYALYDLSLVAEDDTGAFEAVSWRRTEDLIFRILKHFDEVVLLSRESAWMWVLVRGTQKKSK